MNPRTSQRSRTGPRSARSRLEVSTIAGPDPLARQAGGDLDSVDVRELNVEQHHVRAQLLYGAQRGLAVLGLADHVEALRLEQHAGARPEARVIVDDENGPGHCKRNCDRDRPLAPIRLAAPMHPRPAWRAPLEPIAAPPSDMPEELRGPPPPRTGGLLTLLRFMRRQGMLNLKYGRLIVRLGLRKLRLGSRLRARRARLRRPRLQPRGGEGGDARARPLVLGRPRLQDPQPRGHGLDRREDGARPGMHDLVVPARLDRPRVRDRGPRDADRLRPRDGRGGPPDPPPGDLQARRARGQQRLDRLRRLHPAGRDHRRQRRDRHERRGHARRAGERRGRRACPRACSGCARRRSGCASSKGSSLVRKPHPERRQTAPSDACKPHGKGLRKGGSSAHGYQAQHPQRQVQPQPRRAGGTLERPAPPQGHPRMARFCVRSSGSRLQPRSAEEHRADGGHAR